MNRHIAIMCPTRNRRNNLCDVYTSWKETSTGCSTLFPVIDDDNLEEYTPRISGLEYMIGPHKKGRQ